MIVLLYKDHADISSMVHLKTSTGGLFEVRVSGHIYKDEQRLTSRSASPIALVDA